MHIWGLGAWFQVLQRDSGSGVQRFSTENDSVDIFIILRDTHYSFNKLCFSVNELKLVPELSNYEARLLDYENSNMLCSDEIYTVFQDETVSFNLYENLDIFLEICIF